VKYIDFSHMEGSSSVNRINSSKGVSSGGILIHRLLLSLVSISIIPHSVSLSIS
jgi:hypothetical protein